MAYRRRTKKKNGGAKDAAPDNLDEPVHNLGEYPVAHSNLKRFLHIYDGARDEFDGHIIEGLEIDGKKHDIEIPAGTMAGEI